MHHGPPAPQPHEDRAAGYKARLGIWMFLLYAIVYAGFVVINTVDPKMMAIEVAGQTLAVVYGFGLIIFALALALIYNNLCYREECRRGEISPSDEEL
ncbi:MAG: DUF485 domain-containing protein [Anaerolineae bacterium]